MTKEWPKPEQRTGVVTISGSRMETREIDLNELLACCRRELAFRQRCYPKWVSKGSLSEKKAEKELELMREVCEFLCHCVFKAVVRRAG
jgi:hypothetical protein